MPSPYGLIRAGAVASVLGGLLFAGKMFWDRNDAPPWPTDITDTLFFVIPLLFLTGVAGLYAYAGRRTGGVGTAGFVLAGVGGALATIGAAGYVFTEALWVLIFGALAILFVGMIVMGVDMVRTRALPGWSSALPLLIGVLGFATFLANPDDPSAYGDTRERLAAARLLFGSLFGLAWVLLGYTLWTGGDRQGQTAQLGGTRAAD